MDTKESLMFHERGRLEREVLPAVINDPEYAAATIVRLERLRAENEALKVALHDAINRPMGVVPESAEQFYDAERRESE